MDLGHGMNSETRAGRTAHAARSAWGVGFTLVELLVVITIIVILIALLAPALDSAVYQAELAACAARQKSIAQGVVMYAGSSRQAYPTRLINGVTVDLKLGQYAAVGGPAASATDDRVLLQTLIPLSTFNDPMVEAVDLSIQGTAGSDRVWSGYSLFWGVRWVGERPMRRLGDRFTWSVPNGAGGQVVHTFDLLSGDLDYKSTTPEWRNGHPDKAGVMRSLVFQNYRVPTQVPVYTYSQWYSTALRGAVDQNHAHTDGSVSRTIDAVWRRDGNTYPPDDRMVAVPQDFTGATYATYVQQAPPGR